MSSSARYQVLIKASAQKEMDDLPWQVFARVAKAVLSLETDPRRHGSHKLCGTNAYRVRVGNYRIIYTIDDAAHTVQVVAVAHRREAYRQGLLRPRLPLSTVPGLPPFPSAPAAGASSPATGGTAGPSRPALRAVGRDGEICRSPASPCRS
ncbi:MAG: type II toxin-antitoxin system RelE/ParE family toxin [Planctomycetes bacterium]|nr:type II toxin-antitoxin system RelE/ParE family toxin [Planctomycetota bacterium]